MRLGFDAGQTAGYLALFGAQRGTQPPGPELLSERFVQRRMAPTRSRVTVRPRSASHRRRARIHTVLAEPVSGVATPPMPVRATLGSACFDLHAAEAATLKFGTVTLVRTGLRLRAPLGTFLEVRPRSGLSTRGVLMVNAPGTIDRDYAGEVKVPFTFLFAGEYQINPGDRIGQVRVVQDYPTRFEAGEVRPTSDRHGGFGSTGR